MGNGINRNKISEGQDVYMDCDVRANPRIYKVEWIHNVSFLSENFDGKLVSALFLLLSFAVIL